MAEKQVPPPPAPLPQPIRLLVALSALAAIQYPPSCPSNDVKKWYETISRKWLESVCKLLEFNIELLPPTSDPNAVRASAEDQITEWTAEDISRVAGMLVEASVAAAAQGVKKEEAQLSYTPLSRTFVYSTLSQLGLHPENLVPIAEKNLSATLFSALKAANEDEAKKKVESSRQAHAQGWGGSLGRHLATGAGVIAGGVLIGVTGGLAAPAIAALLAPLGVGGILAGGAAPVVLGTLFGVGGGGLAGRRVRERWRGVEEFSFVEVGAGTRATKEEIEDLQESRKRLQIKNEQKAKDEKEKAEAAANDKEPGEKGQEAESDNGSVSDVQAAKASDDNRADLEAQLINMSQEAGTRSNLTPPTTPTGSPTESRPTLDSTADEAVEAKKKPPSLTATIVVPGLLTVSKTEAITAWRSICSEAGPVGGTHAPGYTARVKERRASSTSGEKAQTPPEEVPLQQLTISDDKKEVDGIKSGLKDGRDVYLLRFESERMLKTGRDIDLWVEGKIKGKIKAEIIKRTVLNAYFAAVKLPLTVYGMASMSLDNSWIQAQDRARKAGRILGEVLEKRVQGERPVVLIGSSLGAYTVLEALLYLASLRETGANGPVPKYVESAYLISLPSAPTAQEWSKCRSVVSRRLVNAWSNADFVLAGVCRLHEVLSRAATLNSGVSPAGLGPVNQPGVEDIDVSSVLRGHMELQAKMAEVIRIINVDA